MMPIVFLCLAAALIPASPQPNEPRYFRSRLEPEGELLEAEFVDLEGDGRMEVCLAVLAPTGRRELRFHRLSGSGFAAQPFRVVDVLDEALCFGFAEVRAEAGLELFFLTAEGAWSYSLEHDGYRNNARPLAREPLLFDVPDPHVLPRWWYVLPHAGGDLVLLPGTQGAVLFGPPAGTDDTVPYRRLLELPRMRLADAQEEQQRRRRALRIGSNGMTLGDLEPAGPRLLGSGFGGSSFLSSHRSYLAPALVDWTGDGTLDVLSSNGQRLALYPVRPEPLPESPERRQDLPEALLRDDVRVWFRELDDDGRSDLIARCANEADGMQAEDITLLALGNDPRGLLTESPRQVLRFHAHDLDVHVSDVNDDGQVDLVLSQFLMPSLIGTVTGVEIEVTDMIFLGTSGKRPFERKPILKESRTFDEETAVEGITDRQVRMDLNGDGIADWVEIDAMGRLNLRRTVVESHFFGDDSWSIEASPWMRFEDFGRLGSMEVIDLNDDALGDVVSRTQDSVAILMSRADGRSGR